MLHKWCEITSCSGVIDLYEARNNPKRFTFWFIIMVGLVGASVFYTAKTVYGYIVSPTVTNIDVVPVESIDMPDMVICYNGGVNVTAMKEENFTEEFILAYMASWDYKSSSRWNADLMTKELSNYLKVKKIIISEFIQKFWYSCETIISSGSSIRCKDSQVMMTSVGVCYTFKNVKPQWYPSVYSGVELKLSEPNDSFMQIYNDHVKNRYLGHGFGITLDKAVGTTWSHRFLLVPPNTKTAIVLNLKRYKRFNDGTCDTSKGTTTSSICFYKCYTEVSKLQFNCVHPAIYELHDPSVEVCNTFNYNLSSFNDSGLQSCCSKCRPLCDEWVYETVLSYNHLPNNKAGHATSTVHIGHSAMQYTVIEQVQAFTMDMAIANIGGQSGLWLGVSVATIVQAIYYLVLSFCCSGSDKTVDKFVMK